MTTNKTSMLEQAKQAQNKAYAPYSKYHVGACIKTDDGQLFSGCNVENASYGLTMCAETSAISHMINAGQQKISEVFVIGSSDEYCTPCGRCRQMIREFMAPDGVVHCAKKDGTYQTFTLEHLLPESFGPEHIR